MEVGKDRKSRLLGSYSQDWLLLSQLSCAMLRVGGCCVYIKGGVLLLHRVVLWIRCLSRLSLPSTE